MMPRYRDPVHPDEPVVLRAVTAAAALERLAELLAVFTAAFAGPPWHADAQPADARREVAAEQLGHPGTKVVLAERAGTVLGAAWGWATAPPDDDLHRLVRTVPGAEGYLDGSAFTLVELMVHPDVQRRGLGARLLADLVGDRRAWLLSHPDGAGMALYTSTGWRSLGECAMANGVPMLVMVRPGRPVGDAPA